MFAHARSHSMILFPSNSSSSANHEQLNTRNTTVCHRMGIMMISFHVYCLIFTGGKYRVLNGKLLGSTGLISTTHSEPTTLPHDVDSRIHFQKCRIKNLDHRTLAKSHSFYIIFVFLFFNTSIFDEIVLCFNSKIHVLFSYWHAVLRPTPSLPLRH